jgi:hypothetical protein
MVATPEELCSQMRPHYGLRKFNLNLRCFVNQILDESETVLTFVEVTMLTFDWKFIRTKLDVNFGQSYTYEH